MIGLWLLLQYIYSSWMNYILITYHDDSVNLYFTYLFRLFYRLREHHYYPHHFYLQSKVCLWWLLCVSWVCCLGHGKYLECWSSSQSKGWNKLTSLSFFSGMSPEGKPWLEWKGALQLLNAAAYPISSKAWVWGGGEERNLQLCAFSSWHLIEILFCTT